VVKFLFDYILYELGIESPAAFLVNFSVGLVLGFRAGSGKFLKVGAGSGILFPDHLMRNTISHRFLDAVSGGRCM
jgi:hypothetical protein